MEEKRENAETRGKQILEQQAQEQMRLQAQREEEEQEHREKLRRLKERRMLAFLTYMRMIIEDEQLRKANEALLDSLLKDSLMSQLRQSMQTNRAMRHSISLHHASVANFLFAGESPAERERRTAVQQETKVDDTEFSALAMADLCRKPENQEDVEKVFLGEPPSENLVSQRRDSVANATEALESLSRGDIQKMETTIREGLAGACQAFSQTKDTLTAIHWSKQINGILSIVNSHPVLFQGGVKNPLFEAATGAAALGRMLENGLDALNELHTARLKGVNLSDEKERELQSQILLMEQVDTQRSNEQYQKVFAKSYHPQNGMQQDALKNLLKQLHTSEALYTLSTMNRDEKLFALSDMESRRTLSKDLLVPHTEKKMTGPSKPLPSPTRQQPPAEKKPDIEPPVLRR